MDHLLVYTLAECCAMLAAKTGRAWSRGELFEQILRHSLQVFATTPTSSRIVIRSLGQDHYAGFPAAGRRLALLLTPHIRDLWLHGSATTGHPALEPGDPGYSTFPQILAARAKHNRPLHTRETWPYDDWDNGEYMGESDVCVFAEAVEVNDESCRIPLHTIDELARLVLAARDSDAAHSQNAVKSSPTRGITKSQVLTAFEDIVPVNLEKRLGDAEGLYGDKGARVQRGTPGGRHKSLWNPVILAVGFRQQNSVARHLLNRPFQEHWFLNDWWEEWKAVYADLP